ncbi:MAG: M48 family metallopeptidase [Ardenticatenales bacterium]|nr:M48 family metallopeptidase [Ardenticatenales bacterium]
MTEDTLPIRHQLKNISPKSYEHPGDRAATAALKQIPLLDVAIKKIVELNLERLYRQILLGNSVKIGPEQLPHIYSSYQHVLYTLDMPDEYDLYISQTPVPNAMVFGTTKPIIVLNSGLVSLLDDSQIQAVLAHEVGHILSDHVLYITMMRILIFATGLSGILGLPLWAVQLALLEWFRAAEFTADRAATLVVRDPMITCRTMMNLAGGSSSEKFNIDAFIKQAEEYEQWPDGYDKALRFFSEIGTTHPFPVWRVSEIMKWVKSGDFDRIIRGEYRTRDEKIDPAKEASEAASFYTQRFQDVMKEVGAGVRNASEQTGESARGAGQKASESARDFGKQVGEWLRKNGGEEEEEKDKEQA